MHRIQCLAAIFLAALLSGCMTAWDARGLKGDYQGTIDAFENGGGYETFARDDNYRILVWVCDAYFYQRERIKFDECVDRLQPLIPEDWHGMQNDHDIRAFLLSRQAQLKLETNELEEARSLSARAIGEMRQGITMELDSLPHIAPYVGVYKIDGIIAALQDREADARIAIEKIETAIATEKVWGGRDHMVQEAEFEVRRDAAGSVLVALGDYAEAVDVLTSRYERKATFNSVMDNITSFGLDRMLQNIAKGLTSSYHNSRKLPMAFVLAKAHLEAGDTDEAKQLLDQLLQLNIINGFSEIYYAALYERGRIALMEGDRDLAIKHFTVAVDEIEKQRSSVNSEVGKIGFAGDKQAVYGDLVAALFDQGEIEQAFVYAERAKARALVDLLAEKKAFGSEGSERNRLSRRAIVELDRTDREQQLYTREKFDALTSGKRGIAVTPLEVVPDGELASLVTATNIETSDILSRLKASETLVEFFGHGDRMFVFVLRRDGIAAARIDADGLTDKVSSFRRGLQDPSSLRYAAESRWLYDRLIRPVIDLAPTSQLIIVPHGALHYLPFGAIGAPESPLIERFSYRILPSASVMTYLDNDVDAKSGLLILGNPDLNEPGLDLPFAEREALMIGNTHTGTSVLVGREATETRLKESGARFRRLHVASHGVFDAAEPMASRLLLAPDGHNDGSLTVAELYDLELDVDLVTLSACETGLGDVASGDDVVGFTRGFLFAGANSIVSSLWQVDDMATMRLMLSFYGSLTSMPAHDALRAAQRRLIESGVSHPYYWAAFQVTGA